MEIASDDLRGEPIVDFLEDHVAELRSLSPPESSHALDLVGLRSPDVRFWTATEDGHVLGCVALKTLTPAHAELKSMRTARTRTRTGMATRLLLHVLEEARLVGFRRISLETGSEEFFGPARRLYARHGFDFCEPFGDYRRDPLSVFMTRAL